MPGERDLRDIRETFDTISGCVSRSKKGSQRTILLTVMVYWSEGSRLRK